MRQRRLERGDGMTRAEKTANSFTCLGIEGIVRANERKLEELDRLDGELGDHCRLCYL